MAALFGLQLAITFGVNKVVKLDADGTLQVKSTMSLVWNDTNWAWITSTASGWALPDTILVPASDLWTPRFQLANCESESCVIVAPNKTRVIITSVGTVILILEPLLKASCEMDLSLFPFDNQTCKLEFQMPDHLIVDNVEQQSDSNDANFAKEVLSDLQIDVHLDTQLLANAYASDEWLLRDVAATFTDFQFKLYKKGNNSQWSVTNDDVEIHRSGFVVSLFVHRHSGYFVANLIVPLFIVQVCGLFTVLLPGTSDARLNLAVTVLLGFIFVQTITASVMPTSDDNPYISQYVIGSLVLSVCNLAGCAVCSSIASFPQHKAPPPGVRFLAHHPRELLRFLCPRRDLFRRSSSRRRRQAPQRGSTAAAADSDAPVDVASLRSPVNMASAQPAVNYRTRASMSNPSGRARQNEEIEMGSPKQLEENDLQENSTEGFYFIFALIF